MKKIGHIIKHLFLFLIDETYFDTRTNFYSTVSMIINFIWAFIKLTIGYITHSFFFCVSAGYTLCIGICKQIYLFGRKKELQPSLEIKYVINISIILFLASCLYTLYMSKLFIWPENHRNYGTILSISFATFAFVNFFISIRGLVKSRKKNDSLLLGLKMVKLATALTSIVLTQVCLLEACSSGESLVDNSFYDALTGTICGCLCTILAIILFIYAIKKKKQLV